VISAVAGLSDLAELLRRRDPATCDRIAAAFQRVVADGQKGLTIARALELEASAERARALRRRDELIRQLHRTHFNGLSMRAASKQIARLGNEAGSGRFRLTSSGPAALAVEAHDLGVGFPRSARQIANIINAEAEK
jgi:hypothetical protein